MASAQPREWTGLQQFPRPTQMALLSLLGKLRRENVDSLTILVLGKSGVGKSSTVNSIIGERVAVVSAFQSETTRTLMCSRAQAGFTLNVIDTPGLVDGIFVNSHALDTIRRSLLNKTIDVMIYVDRLDSYRIDNLDRQVIRAISRNFGPQIWKVAIVVLTHAQLSPPDGIDYSEFFAKRSAALHEVVRKEAGLKKGDPPIPIALVENSGRCTTNSGGEKVLPDGTVWLPKLVEHVVDVRTSPAESIFIDQKVIEGPNANKWGKPFIPLILAFQYLFVIKTIQKSIKNDISDLRRKPLWEILTDENRSATIRREEMLPGKGRKSGWRFK